MMTFAQALVRIEELIKAGNDPDEINKDLMKRYLYEHAGSIVQLGKVAREMRKQFTLHHYDGDADRPWAAPSIKGCIFKLGNAAQEYDKLMKGDEG